MFLCTFYSKDQLSKWVGRSGERRGWECVASTRVLPAHLAAMASGTWSTSAFTTMWKHYCHPLRSVPWFLPAWLKMAPPWTYFNLLRTQWKPCSCGLALVSLGEASRLWSTFHLMLPRVASRVLSQCQGRSSIVGASSPWLSSTRKKGKSHASSKDPRSI